MTYHLSIKLQPKRWVGRTPSEEEHHKVHTCLQLGLQFFLRTKGFGDEGGPASLRGEPMETTLVYPHYPSELAQDIAKVVAEGAIRVQFPGWEVKNLVVKKVD